MTPGIPRGPAPRRWLPSMRARLASGETRWKRAHAAARDVLASAREGDAVAIVLAGKPARLALGTTTNLAQARRVLDELAPSDRGTDLAGAVALARGALSGGAGRHQGSRPCHSH